MGSSGDMPDCFDRERITVLQAGLDDAGSK